MKKKGLQVHGEKRKRKENPITATRERKGERKYFSLKIAKEKKLGAKEKREWRDSSVWGRGEGEIAF